MNVADLMTSSAPEGNPAVLYRDTVVTYGELRERASRIAGALVSRGCRKGDRVGVCSENSPFFIAAYLGIIRAGLVAVPFPTELTPASFAKLVSDAGIHLLFVSQRFFGRIAPWAQANGVTLLPERLVLELACSTAAMPEIDPSADLAALMFTSGSTGAPKGVMVSHRNIECNSRDIISYMALSSTDRCMVVLPFHYCFGTSLLHTHLMSGGSLVLNNDFRLYPETVLREMQQKECTGIAGVPSIYQLLLRKSRFRELSFPTLRWFQQAGGKLPNPCIAEVLQSFPAVRFFLMYGQTEATARLSFLPPERLGDKLGSIGQGLPSTKLEVLKPDGTAVQPGSDEIGEIVASGDNITLGYWKDPEETAKYFKRGRLYTGDIARVDAEGFIFIVERERELIKSGGNRVSAKEVEDIIAEISEVVEVAVLGTPHELLGEAIQAFLVVVPQARITAETVLAYCRKRLPAFKLPENIHFLKAMPHNSSGKVLKPKLKEMLQQRTLATANPTVGTEVGG
jgi:long-chain acyl-CoA synthetase